jgi:GGDEF domain-containing protein
LISIRKSLTELDRQELQETTARCYALALRSTAQYAIEPEPGQAAEFREHLAVLQQKLEASGTSEDVQAVQASFRGELRDYRDKIHEKIGALRKEMEAAAAAMQIFADGVTVSGADYDQQVKQQLVQLDATAASNDLGQIRRGIHSATTGIAASIDQMRRGNQLVIAGLRDEIRLLHRAIESERRSLFTDRSSGVWNRHKMDERIDELLRLNEPFCLLLIFVQNLKSLDSLHSRTVTEGALKALLQRFGALLGEDAMIGRWSEDEFAAILEVAPAAALSFSREAARKLSGNYSVQENGLARNVELQAMAGVIEREPAANREDFRKKLDKLAGALAASSSP